PIGGENLKSDDSCFLNPRSEISDWTTVQSEISDLRWAFVRLLSDFAIFRLQITQVCCPLIFYRRAHRLSSGCPPTLERRGRLAFGFELFTELPISTAQFGVSPSDDGPRFVYCLHRFFVTVRQNPERSCAQRLLQLRKADVKTPPLVMAVDNQLHSFVT